MPGEGQICALHEEMAKGMKEAFCSAVVIRPNPQNWRKTLPPREINFELDSKSLVDAVRARRNRGGQFGVHRVTVFPLLTGFSPDIEQYWVSWHEGWRKNDDKTYILLTASWTLFRGYLAEEEKRQILRADWDQLPDCGSGDAGQPHWHFDQPVFAYAVETGAQSGALLEFDAGHGGIHAVSAVSKSVSGRIGSVHLAMGAWDRTKDCPGCWQRSYSDDCGELLDWCMMTLQYLQGQFRS